MNGEHNGGQRAIYLRELATYRCALMNSGATAIANAFATLALPVVQIDSAVSVGRVPVRRELCLVRGGLDGYMTVWSNSKEVTGQRPIRPTRGTFYRGSPIDRKIGSRCPGSFNIDAGTSTRYVHCICALDPDKVPVFSCMHACSSLNIAPSVPSCLVSAARLLSSPLVPLVPLYSTRIHHYQWST